MSTYHFFMLILIMMSVVTGLLYVTFGQITVRKLRRITELQDAMGVQFVSGFDIVNVAQALAIPRALARKLRGSPLGIFEADPDLLEMHTTRVDRALAHGFYWSFFVTGGGGILLVISSFFVGA